MRIAINARTLATQQLRGWSRYTLNLVRELSHLDTELFLFSDRPINKKWLQGFDESNIKIDQAQGLFYLDWEQVVLPRLCRQYKVDVLHCPINYGLPMHPVCKRVLTMHDAIEPAFYDQRMRWWQKFNPQHIYVRWLNYFSRRASDRIITVSDFSKHDLEKYYGISSDRISVIYEAADPIFNPENVRPAANLIQEYGIDLPYFFYVGGLEERKNMDFLLRAFAKLAGQKVQLVIAGGGGSHLDRLKDQAQGLGISQQVNFLGHVSEELLPSLYAHALCFVYPSLYEGFGLQLVEAMKMGCPVLASRCTSLPEVLGYEDALFDPTNEGELFAKMALVLKDHSFREAIRRHCIERSNFFSWRKTAEQTLLAYQLSPA